MPNGSNALGPAIVARQLHDAGRHASGILSPPAANRLMASSTTCGSLRAPTTLSTTTFSGHGAATLIAPDEAPDQSGHRVRSRTSWAARRDPRHASEPMWVGTRCRSQQTVRRSWHFGATRDSVSLGPDQYVPLTAPCD